MWENVKNIGIVGRIGVFYEAAGCFFSVAFLWKTDGKIGRDCV